MGSIMPRRCFQARACCELVHLLFASLEHNSKSQLKSGAEKGKLGMRKDQGESCYNPSKEE